MGSATSRGRLASVAGGFLLSSQTVAWSLVASPLGAGDLGMGLLFVAAATLTLGATLSARPGAGSWRRGLFLLPALAGLLALAAASALLALPSFGTGSAMARFLASAVVVGPAGLCGGILLSQRGVPPAGFFLGLLSGVSLVLGTVSWWPPPLALAGLPVVWLGLAPRPAVSQGEPGARGPSGGRPSFPLLQAMMMSAALLTLVLGAMGRITRLLAGTSYQTRSILFFLTLGGLVVGGLVGGRFRPRGSSRLLAAAVVWSVLAAHLLALFWSLPSLARLYLRVIDPHVWPSMPGAWLLGGLMLFPLAALGGLGISWMTPAPDPEGRPGVAVIQAVGSGVAAGAVLLGGLLAPHLGPGRLFQLCVATVPLGLVLPAVLDPGGRSRAWLRLGAAPVVVLVSFGVLFLSGPSDRLLTAGLAWHPQRFLVSGGEALANGLGQQQVVGFEPRSTGVVARVRRASGPVETVWQGWTLATGGAHPRSCAAVASLLAAVLHPHPDRVLLVGADGAAEVEGVRAVLPGARVDRFRSVPFGRGAAGPAAAPNRRPGQASLWAVGTGYDFVMVHPLPPQAAGSGLAWSHAALERGRHALAAEGVLSLRLDPQSFRAPAFQTVLSTFLGIFPESSLWFDGCDLLLVGSGSPVRISMTALEELFGAVAPEVEAAGLLHPADLLARFIMPRWGLEALSEGRPAERLFRPRLALEPDPGVGERRGLLARFTVFPLDLNAWLADLAGLDPESLREDVEGTSRAIGHLLAALGQETGDPAAALGHAQAALEMRPEDPLIARVTARLAYAAARSDLAVGKDQAALEWMEQAIRLAPEQVTYHLLHVHLLEGLGHLESARRRLDALGRRFPDSYPVLLLQGLWRMNRGNTKGAGKFLRRAADLGYETADLDVGLARIAWARRRPEEARRLVRRAAKRAPDPPGLMAHLGEQLLRAGFLEEGVEYLERAKERGRDAADVNGPLGEAALEGQDYVRASRLLSRAVAQEPASGRFRLSLGSALLLSGNAMQAVEHLRKAVGLRPDDAMAHLNLAAALLKSGQKNEAREELAIIGTRLEGNPVLARLRRELGLRPPEGDAGPL